jgi:peptide/nickel transport system permease protein
MGEVQLVDAARAGVMQRKTTAPESQLRLTWRRFRRHRLALAAGVVILLFYTVVLFADFIAYSNPVESEAERGLLPPQRVHFFDEGRFRPHVYALEGRRDPVTFRRVYTPNPDEKIPIVLFARGWEYSFLGLFTTDLHLIGVGGARAEDTLFLLGTDLQGRDLFSRIIVATRISMTIGLVAVTLTLVLGILLGGISGYYGGFIDLVIQRVIEVLHAIPTIPLWMGLAASLPRDWSVLRIYFAITIIISLVSWTHLARVVRGRFLSLRREEFVTAAKVVGCREGAIIFRHMLPSFVSHIIAVVTLAIPAMIISETSLSFLGLGIRPPAVSWGVLLQQAQNVQSIAITPWLLLPAVPVIVAVLAFNFLGDGMRDAADPYSPMGR